MFPTEAQKVVSLAETQPIATILCFGSEGVLWLSQNSRGSQLQISTQNRHCAGSVQWLFETIAQTSLKKALQCEVSEQKFKTAVALQG